jgi:mRNA interferase RelE/StbE
VAEYSVTFARSARKELERLDEPHCSKVLSRIRGLSKNPRPDGCRKLQGAVDLWRIRIGEYRVVYRIEEGRRVVDVIVVRHRSTAYR